MRYDVVIVGGGAAGAVLAARLAADAGTSVLLLEAGPDYPDLAQIPAEIRLGHTRYAEAIDSPHNWALRGTLTDEQRDVHVAQGKVIGGGSSINGQAMQRGFPQDFDAWAALGNDEWSYARVLPYFRRSERDLDIVDQCHGSEGPMPVRRRREDPVPRYQQAFHDACRAAGYAVSDDTNGLEPAGLGVAPSNNIDGVRMSTAMTHLAPMRHRLNLTVRGNVMVRRVLIERGRAVGVEAESGGTVFRIEAGRVVLSAGAIRSPQLLMLSGVGPADQLRSFGIPVVRDLPGVGESLWNHLSAQVPFKVRDGIPLAPHQDAVQWSLHYTAAGSKHVNDMVLRTTPAVDPRPERVPGLRTKVLGDGVPPESIARITCTLGLPEGAGWVRLASADPGAQPAFDYRYLQHPEDRRRVRDGVRLANRLLASPAYRDVIDHRIQPSDAVLADDAALDLWLMKTVGSARHVSGTCRMGPAGDRLAVVDQRCRVRDIEGLSVVDASVVPRIPRSGGLHATVIMIGERAAEWVAG